MKKLIFYIILFNLLNSIYSIVPLWNFENTTIKLNLPYSYKFTKYLYNIPLTLEKTFNISENKISQKNTINIKNNELIINNKDWDNIESFYEYGDYFYICPKGKYNMFKIRKNNQEICQEIYNKKYDKEWELKCYYHEKIKDNTDLITVFYLNINSKIQSYHLGKLEWKGNAEIHSGLLDFIWTTQKTDKYYYMFAIGIKGEQIELFSIKSEYDDELKFDIQDKSVSKCLTYSHACFYDDYLYFVTYNNTTIITGFTQLNGEVTESTFNKIKMNINEISPFNFYDEVTINKINFIEESQYLYYNISTDKNETYYGIIDIESNKIIYNTNKEISEFKPLSKSSMLAISGSSAYLICTFKSDNGDDCIYKCDNDPLIDTRFPNSCGKKCSDYTLIPENVCIESCDENIFTIKNNNQCGLCKDFDINIPFKVVNTTGCIAKKPENSYFVNEKLKLIACEERFFLRMEFANKIIHVMINAKHVKMNQKKEIKIVFLVKMKMMFYKKEIALKNVLMDFIMMVIKHV